MSIKIEGKQINLRTLRLSDAKAIYQNVDFDVARYTPIPYPYKLKDAISLIKKAQSWLKKKAAFVFGIELKEKKQIVGTISLVRIDYKNKAAELSYWLGKAYWGKGIMKEAIRLILNFGFKKLRLVRIHARVMHPNIRSAKLLEKCGFHFEGRLRKSRLVRGRWIDHLIYSMLRSEFRVRKSR
ncbi:MAG: GNAT family protein [Candidatus Pacearchaeota archaeon]